MYKYSPLQKFYKKQMKFIFTLIVSAFMIGGIHSQNSIIQNHDFETTNWQDIAWFSQTNTGSPIIVNQSDAFFIKDDIFAHSGLHFAYIGGVQSPAGLYEGDLVQEFYVPMSGNGQLYFSVCILRLVRLLKLFSSGWPFLLQSSSLQKYPNQPHGFWCHIFSGSVSPVI